jgi:hypothetical protein
VRVPLAAALLIGVATRSVGAAAQVTPRPPTPGFGASMPLQPEGPPRALTGGSPKPANAAPPIPITLSPKLNAVRVSSGPTVDGRLDEPVWLLAAGRSDFTQQSPYDGSPPSEPTVVKVLYDGEALYIGFECTQMKTPIARHLTRRDEDSESDWVWIHIDSRNDSRAATFFAVNVAGVLVDGIMHDGMIFSPEWDENWEARTATTATGWSAEIRIPLRVLRFSPHLPVQSWGFWASRFVGLLQEKDDWPYISREVATPIPFFGRLDDLRDLPRGGPVELRPFALGQVRHRSVDTAMVANGFDANPSAGIDLKLHITQSLTLDAAINPDFAQVEADTLILNLGNYEVQFPEKRPLFLEGADLFSTPLGIFYSRRIGIPPITPTVKSAPGSQQDERLVDVPGAATIYAATKLSGRLRDAWNVGFLSAVASRNDYEVQPGTPGPVERRTVEPMTAFNVLRVRRELGDRAHLGAIATTTNRLAQPGGVCPSGDPAPAGTNCFRDAAVGGLDVLWRSPAGTYVASGQAVAGAVYGGQPDVQLDGTSIGPGSRGFGGWLRLAKDGGRHVLTELVYTGIGRNLTYNDLGFMPRQNLHEVKAGVELRSLEPGPLTLERHARLDLSTRRSLDGLDIGSTAEIGFSLRLQGFWLIHGAVDVAPAHFDDREVGDGAALERVLFAGAKAEVASDPRQRWGGQIKSELRLLDGGLGLDVQGSLAWRPLPQFKIEIDPQLSYNSGEQRYASHAILNDPAAANPYIFGRLLARSVGAVLRVQYTFTPRLSLQTFAQLFLASGHYDDFRQAPRQPGAHIAVADLTPLTIGPPLDADFEQAALNVNVVLRWEYRLGSTLFLVYSRSQVPDVVVMAPDTATLSASALGRMPAVDTVLLKLSFWWAS